MYKIIVSCLLIISFTGCSSFNNATSVPGSDKLEIIPLELTTHLGDQQQFIEGDEIQFLLNLGQDAYVYMYYIDTESNITQILPNQNQKSNYFTAGYFLPVPEYKNLYRFTIRKPFGKESIWVFASDKSIATDQSLHTIEAIRLEIKQSSTRAYGEYTLRITTRAKSRL